jgi:hypothetical protein
MAALLRLYMDDNSGDIWTRQRCFDLLTVAQQEIANLGEESFANLTQGCADFTVVKSTEDRYEFDLPADFARLERGEKVVANSKAIPATHTQFFNAETKKSAFDLFYGLGTTTSPLIYIRANKLGVVFPAEAYTLRIFYTRSLTALDDPGDISEIPVAYHSFVVLHATALARSAEGRGGLTPDQRVMYDRQMAAFLSHAMHRDGRLEDSVTYVGD